MMTWRTDMADIRLDKSTVYTSEFVKLIWNLSNTNFLSSARNRLADRSTIGHRVEG